MLWIRVAVFCAYLSCVPIANWMIANVGTVCVPQGPCLIPVGFGLMAPSAVAVMGAALVLRDVVQRSCGLLWSILATFLGACLAWAVTNPQIAIASATAFLISELADTLVYTPLQRRGLILAVLASGVVGATIDSLAFLWMAFGSLDFLAGQIVGKAWAIAFASPLIYGARRMQRIHA